MKRLGSEVEARQRSWSNKAVDNFEYCLLACFNPYRDLDNLRTLEREEVTKPGGNCM